MKIKPITNINFWSYGIGFLLYINTIFELDLFLLGLRVSEICIIGVLLFVIILIFNEINKLLRENYIAKISTKSTYYKSQYNKSLLEKNFNSTESFKKLYFSAYSLLLSII